MKAAERFQHSCGRKAGLPGIRLVLLILRENYYTPGAGGWGRHGVAGPLETGGEGRGVMVGRLDKRLPALEREQGASSVAPGLGNSIVFY